MKKLINLFIVFFLLFNLSVNGFTFILETEKTDISSFDVFALDTMQKIFSNTLSCYKLKISQNGDQTKHKDLNFCFYDTEFVFRTCFAYNYYDGKILKFCNETKYNLCLYQEYRSFYNCFCDIGISRYRQSFNSYIAIALFDAENPVSLYINKD